MTRIYDLPVSWDGDDVSWGDWKLEPSTSMRFHSVTGDGICTACGVLGRQLYAWGTVAEPDGPHRRLTAHRCLHCDHDTVYDVAGDELFDLDDSDYGPEGSWPPGQQQGALAGL